MFQTVNLLASVSIYIEVLSKYNSISGVVIDYIYYSLCNALPYSSDFKTEAIITSRIYYQLNLYTASLPNTDLDLPSSLTQGYAFKIIGTLNVKVLGQYIFSLEATDGVKFTIKPSSSSSSSIIFNKLSCTTYEIFSTKVEIKDYLLDFEIIGTQVNSEHVFRILWKNSESSSDELKIISGEDLLVTPTYLTRLRYDSSTLMFPQNQEVTYQLFYSGFPSSFELKECTLPIGLNFRTNTGTIEGSSSYSNNIGHCKINGIGLTSSTQSEFSFMIIDHILKSDGVIGKFFEINGGDLNIQDRSLSDPSKYQLVSQFYQNNINYNGTDRFWKYLPLTISLPFSSSWEGYITISYSWRYCFYCNATDICHVEIDDQLIISKTYYNLDEISDCQFYEAKEHKIRVVGHQLHNNSILIISISGGYPIQTKHPIFDYHFYPKVPFHYKLNYFTLIKGQLFNNPPLNFLADSSSIDNDDLTYSVNPQLPAGISLYENGTIGGNTTLSNLPLSNYTIKITDITNNQYVTTTISLSIISVVPPQGLKYSQNIIESSLGVVIPTLESKIGGGEVEKYYTIPELPKGIILDQLYGTISGSPMEIFNGTITIYASNSGGSCSYDITFIFSDCNNGDSVFLSIVFSRDSSQEIIVQFNEIEIYSRFGKGINETKVFCQNGVGEFLVYLKFHYGNVKPYISLSYYPNVIIYEGYTNLNHTSEQFFKFSNYYSDTIKISMPSLSVTDSFSYIEISPTIEGAYSTCLITNENELFSGLTYNKQNCMISGIPTEAGDKYFNSEICNPRGCGRCTFRIVVNQCPIVNEVINIKLLTIVEANTQSFSLYDSNNTLIYELNNLKDNQYYTSQLCIESGIYIVEMSSTSVNGWFSGSYLSINSNSGIPLFYGSMIKQGSVASKINVNFFINSSTEVSYSDYYIENWMDVDFTDTWSKIIPSRLPNFRSISRFYRYSFTLTDTIFYETAIYALSFKYINGIAIYVNSVVLFTDGLIPPFNPTTPGVSKNEYVTMYFSNSVMSLNYKNVLAIEVHQNDTAHVINPDLFSFQFYIKTGEKSHNYLKEIPFEMKSNVTDISLSPLYDDDYNTDVSFSFLPDLKSEILLYFPPNYTVFINQYSFTSATTDSKYDPKGWEFYGSLNGYYWNLLDTRTNITFNNRREIQYYSIDRQGSDLIHSCSYFKWVFTELGNNSKGLSQFSLSEIHFVGVNDLVCKGTDTLPPVSAGESVTLDCSDYYHGNISYKCVFDVNTKIVNWSQPIDNCVVDPPTEFYVIPDKIEGYSGYTTTPIYISSKGLQTNTTISPDLPANIIFTTNSISGRWNNPITQVYLLKVCNSNGCLEHQLSVNVIEPFCPEDGNYPQTKIGVTVILDCAAGELGVIKRECLFENRPVWGEETSSCTIPDKQKDNNTTVIAIAIIIPLVIIIIAGVAFYFFYPRIHGRTRAMSHSINHINKNRSSSHSSIKGVNLSEYGFI